MIVLKAIFFCLAITIAGNLMGQTKKQYMQFADENFADGDYYGASIYYQKAMQIDSVDIDLLFKYAEALRLYNNYEKAEYYYQKVYKKGNGRIHPKCVYWLATMQKFNGKYKQSAKTWKRVKTVTRNKKSFDYKKAKQEVRSCAFARRVARNRTEAEVINLGEEVNTFDSEFSPVLLDSNTLLFSSLRADKMGGDQQVNDEVYNVKVFKASRIDSTWRSEKPLPKTINNLVNHNANGTFSPDGKRFYFTRCSEFNVCKIMESTYENGKWGSADPININASGSTSTQPNITLINNQEVLFFASDRKGGMGKMDIWYAIRKSNGKFKNPVNAGKNVNSIDNEITPFYNPKEGNLYFSSQWHYGLGGFDIFKSKGDLTGFAKPENLEPPINTRWNDFYYISDTTNYKAYLASNREGSLYYKSPTCCNDIYEVQYPKPIVPEEIEIATLEDLNKYLPVKLYFHNDCPNPRTRDTTTNLNYLTTYDDYIKLVPKYKTEYSKGLSEEKAVEATLDIKDFFKDYVEKGVSDLALFTKLLLLELQKGTRIDMTVRGFASPLAKTDYNVRLTGRRISSLLNYLDEFDNGLFKPYIESGQLTFVRIPFGEYTANTLVSDNVNDQRNSVYSRSAALERKIEIVSVNLSDEKEAQAEISLDKEIHDFGKITSLDSLTHSFTITNNGKSDLIIQDIETSCGCTSTSLTTKTIQSGKTATIRVAIKPQMFRGKQMQTVTLQTNGVPKSKKISLTFEQ